MIYVVGIGPGDRLAMTVEAEKIIKDSDIIVGYKTYLDLISELIADKEVVSTGMTKEVERCTRAIEISLENPNKIVSIVSSGDSGIYGMAGLVYELAEKLKYRGKIKVVPGVTSSVAAAALLGAPIMHDYATISLSDLLTPWDLIEKRIELSSEADMVICLYNPRSKTRVRQLPRAVELMLKHKDGNTPVGIVKDAYRENQVVYTTTLDSIDYGDIDMRTVIIVGNKTSYINDGKIITPRGYKL